MPNLCASELTAEGVEPDVTSFGDQFRVALMSPGNDECASRMIQCDEMGARHLDVVKRWVTLVTTSVARVPAP